MTLHHNKSYETFPVLTGRLKEIIDEIGRIPAGLLFEVHVPSSPPNFKHALDFNGERNHHL